MFLFYLSRRKKRAGNLSGTYENEQTTGYTSYILSLSSAFSRNNLQTTWNTGKKRVLISPLASE